MDLKYIIQNFKLFQYKIINFNILYKNLLNKVLIMEKMKTSLNLLIISFKILNR